MSKELEIFLPIKQEDVGACLSYQKMEMNFLVLKKNRQKKQTPKSEVDGDEFSGLEEKIARKSNL